MDVPRSKMVKNNTTLADLGTVDLDYPIRFRLKHFEVTHKDGSRHVRAPCLSLQQFNRNGHFVSAISIRVEDLPKLLDGLTTLRFRVVQHPCGCLYALGQGLVRRCGFSYCSVWGDEEEEQPE